MRRLSAYLMMGALAGAIVSPTPSVAFGLRIGPFHFAVPYIPFPYRFLHRRVALRRGPVHVRSGVADEAKTGAPAPAAEQLGPLYPSLALTGLDTDVFWPDRSSTWPFAYEAIFRSTFAKTLPAPETACRQDTNAKATVARIGREIEATPAQRRILQRLGGALAMASAALAKACPKQIPPQPVARLELMQSQIEALTMAIDFIRPPLQQLEQSLSARQRERFAASPPAAATAAACGSAPTPIDWSLNDIDQAVQPAAGQKTAVADLRKALAGAAGDLDGHCPKALPADPLARLQAIEARLDSSWRAVLAMQVAVATFESGLDAKQRNRFAAVDVTQTQ